MLFDAVNVCPVNSGFQLSATRQPNGEYAVGWQDFVYACCVAQAIQALETKSRPRYSRPRAGQYLQPYAKAHNRVEGLEALAQTVEHIEVSNDLIHGVHNGDVSITIVFCTRTFRRRDQAMVKGHRCMEPWNIIKEVVRQAKNGHWVNSVPMRKLLAIPKRSEERLDQLIHTQSKSLHRLIQLTDELARKL